MCVCVCVCICIYISVCYIFCAYNMFYIELHTIYHVQFRTNALGKGINRLIIPAIN